MRSQHTRTHTQTHTQASNHRKWHPQESYWKQQIAWLYCLLFLTFSMLVSPRPAGQPIQDWNRSKWHECLKNLFNSLSLYSFLSSPYPCVRQDSQDGSGEGQMAWTCIRCCHCCDLHLHSCLENRIREGVSVLSLNSFFEWLYPNPLFGFTISCVALQWILSLLWSSIASFFGEWDVRMCDVSRIAQWHAMPCHKFRLALKWFESSFLRDYNFSSHVCMSTWTVKQCLDRSNLYSEHLLSSCQTTIWVSLFLCRRTWTMRQCQDRSSLCWQDLLRESISCKKTIATIWHAGSVRNYEYAHIRTHTPGLLPGHDMKAP